MEKTPLVLLSGTLCDELLWKHQINHLVNFANITVAGDAEVASRAFEKGAAYVSSVTISVISSELTNVVNTTKL